MDINDMDYKGEEIRLGGKTRHIIYSILGLKLIARKYGSVMAGFGKMRKLNPQFDVEAIDDIVMLLHAGLIHEDSSLTAEDVEKWLTIGNMTPIFNVMIKAFIQSTPEAVEGGSDDEVGEQLSTST